MVAQVLCTMPLPDPYAEIVSPLGQITEVGHIPAPAELGKLVAATCFTVICPQLRDQIDGTIMDAAGPQLKAICTYSVGYNNVDVAAASERGIVVANTPGVLTEATADLTLGLLLAAARRLCEGDRAMRSGRYTGWEPEYMLGMELHGALLGIVGFGRIGQAVARRALAFGMQVGYSSPGTSAIAPDLGERCRPMSFDEVIETADIVTLHCPLTPATQHLIDAAVLRRMRPTAILVNTSRGAIVDEPALVQALQQRWIAAAGLDVYEDEPRMAVGLAEQENVVLAPHLGSATRETRAAMAQLCALNTAAVLRGELPPHAVNGSHATRLRV